MECAELLDWPAKLRLLEGFRHRENLTWSAPRLHLVDLQYSDVRLDKGLYNRLVARGSMKRLVTEQQVLDAVDNPPTDTRAYFRGECLRRFGADIAAASWDSVIFDLGGDSLVRIPDAGAAARQQGARRRAAGLGGQRRRTGGTAHHLRLAAASRDMRALTPRMSRTSGLGIAAPVGWRNRRTCFTADDDAGGCDGPGADQARWWRRR